MRLNKQTDYALRTLLFLALQDEGILINIDEITSKLNISRSHLTKITAKMAKLSYIKAVNGKHGGVTLNTATLNVPLSHIAMQFESTFNVIDCSKPLCPLQGACRLNHILNEASQAFLASLEQYTLFDILPKESAEWRIVINKLNIHGA